MLWMVYPLDQAVTGMSIGIHQARHYHFMGSIQYLPAGIFSANYCVLANIYDGVSIYDNRSVIQDAVVPIHREYGAMLNNEIDKLFLQVSASNPTSFRITGNKNP